MTKRENNMYKRLSLEETKACLLAWRIRQDEQAFIELVECYYGLVIAAANKFSSSGLPFEDLSSIGKYGLIKAINLFDYQKYEINAFSSYATVSIENEIKYELKKFHKHNNYISIEQPVGENDEYEYNSLENFLEADEELMEDVIIDHVSYGELISCLKYLTSAEQKVLDLRFGITSGEGKSAIEVARLLNCKRQNVWQHEQKALDKIKKKLKINI